MRAEKSQAKGRSDSSGKADPEAKFLSHYDVLGVSRNASTQDIKSRYYTVVRNHHPDVSKSAQNAKFQSITEAYKVLCNAQSRHKYDTELAKRFAPKQPPPTPPPEPSTSLASERKGKTKGKAKLNEVPADALFRRAHGGTPPSTGPRRTVGKERQRWYSMPRISWLGASNIVRKSLDALRLTPRGPAANPWAELRPSETAQPKRGPMRLRGVQSADPFEHADDSPTLVKLMRARALLRKSPLEAPAAKGDPNEQGTLWRLHFELSDEEGVPYIIVPYTDESDDRVVAQWGIDHLAREARVLQYQGITSSKSAAWLPLPVRKNCRRGDSGVAESSIRNYFFISNKNTPRIAREARS